MPRLIATTDGNTTQILATAYNRPVITRTVNVTAPYIVVTLPAEKVTIAGKQVLAITAIKLHGNGFVDIDKARATAAELRSAGAAILALQADGKTYTPTR